jgi:hypothetical protein
VRFKTRCLDGGADLQVRPLRPNLKVRPSDRIF